MSQAQSSNSNLPETDFNLLEDSEDADNHTSDSTATRLSLQFQLDESYLGQRIDQVAAMIWSDFSREKLKQWLKEGHLLANGNSVKPKYKCEGNELLTLDVELEVQTKSLPENIPLNIVYEDDDIMVVNKPIGMVVHPGAGNSSGTLVNALLYHYPKSAELTRAGLVHRIDKDTSGLLVVAKNLEAQFSLPIRSDVEKKPTTQLHWFLKMVGISVRCGTTLVFMRLSADPLLVGQYAEWWASYKTKWAS